MQPAVKKVLHVVNPISTPSLNSDSAEHQVFADGGILDINLAGIARNWTFLASKLIAGCRSAAVVKADAYGLGAEVVSAALYKAGCRDFYVALLSEALVLRKQLPVDAKLYVLDGLRPGAESLCRQQGIIPVIFTLKQLQAWVDVDAAPAPCAIKVDTGMTRLGFDVEQLLQQRALLLRAQPTQFVSHLACAEQAASAQNPRQLARFEALRAKLVGEFPDADFSLSNSSGIFLGGDFQFDCVRPGAALYGINPQPESSNPVESVVRLRLPVIQLRHAQAGEVVGYGGSYELQEGAQLAVVLGGYADGIKRVLGGRAEGVVRGQRVPVVGRISMDTTVFDVSSLAEPLVEGESYIELLGDDIGVDELAATAGTIAYEVLTSLGRRYQRRYINE